jgi:bacteriorhodopsin
MKKLIASIIAFSPSFAFAQLNNLNDVTSKATAIGTLFIQIIISLTVLYIIYNVFKYLVAGSPDDRAEGGKSILFGVIALFVMFSIWGFVYLLRNTFKFGNDGRTPQEEINNNRLPELPRI